MTLQSQYASKKKKAMTKAAKGFLSTLTRLFGKTVHLYIILIELCTCWNMVINHQKMELFFVGRSLDLERIHPHKFRRTMATRAIDKGMPIEQVQKLLGHQQIDTTMQYAMVNQSNVKSSHRKFIA